MRLALFGNGAMGQLIHARAQDEGHQVAVVLTSHDANRSTDELEELLRDLDAAIDFSVAGAVYANAAACARAGVPLIEGTTGWLSRKPDVRHIVTEHNGALVYGANFSVGV